MNEIVKYHNDFNKITLENINEAELNFLFILLSKIKEHEVEVISIDIDEFKKYYNRRLSDSEVITYLNNTLKKYIRINYTIYLNKERTSWEVFNLFMGFRFIDNKNITLKINAEYKYMIFNVIKYFTSFKLGDFLSIKGKYAKNIFRLLKQFKTTGEACFEWEEFIRMLEIPSGYPLYMIEARILKGSKKELRKLDEFKDLDYEKVRDYKDIRKIKQIKWIWDAEIINKIKSQGEEDMKKSELKELAMQLYEAHKIEIDGYFSLEDWEEWVDYKCDRCARLTLATFKVNIKKLIKLKNRAKESIEASINNNWQGIFPPKETRESKEEKIKKSWDSFVETYGKTKLKLVKI